MDNTIRDRKVREQVRGYFESKLQQLVTMKETASRPSDVMLLDCQMNTMLDTMVALCGAKNHRYDG